LPESDDTILENSADNGESGNAPPEAAPSPERTEASAAREAGQSEDSAAPGDDGQTNADGSGSAAAASPGEDTAEEVNPDEAAARIEAVLFAASEPMSAREIARAARLRIAPAREALARLGEFYGQTGRAFGISEEAGGYILLTKPEFAPYVSSAEKSAGERKLSPAALEVLSIVAYEQPVSRMDVEAVRGVASGPILRSLLEKGLIRITGRGEGLGNPLLYGTTDRFLETVGINSLKDLPDPDTVES